MPTPMSTTSSPVAGSRSAKQRAARFLPAPVVEILDGAVFRFRRLRIRGALWFFGLFGFNIVKKADYYSTLPVLAEIEQTRERWDRPSALVGIDIDVPAMVSTLQGLAARWDEEFRAVTGDYLTNTTRGFGPGYPHLDARTLYFMLREHQPARYLEIGSGLSTYYASLAGARNAAEGSPLQITCIEPYPFEALHSIENFDLVEGFVQDVPLETFEALESGDVLFIDSSHSLKIDSDVAFLFTEVLPRLVPGVLVHIHDVHFPFNGPFPADTWLFGERWPVYWNEAMVVQIFLAHNEAYDVTLSTPMIRHESEQVLTELFDDYVPLAGDANPPSSLWLRRVG